VDIRGYAIEPEFVELLGEMPTEQEEQLRRQLYPHLPEKSVLAQIFRDLNC
jgi:hypothetical protein